MTPPAPSPPPAAAPIPDPTGAPLPVRGEGPRGREAHARLAGTVPDAWLPVIEAAAAASPHLAHLLAREADWLPVGLTLGAEVVAAETADAAALDAADLAERLRRSKRRVALLTALADLGGAWPLETVTGVLSALADRATDLALRAALVAEARRRRLPASDADAHGLFALAMGKGGAGELNYSSDIDLIVLFDETAYAPADRAEARAGLIRATRRAMAMLSDVTEHGYVFRTDLRLRPDPSVTPVCMAAGAALAYYEAEGRTWERAAYIKARPCAGNIAAGARFLADLRPFVWRKHLDFAAIEDAHDMRLRIRDHKGLHGPIIVPGHDLKLGRGGIREIEFFTQTRQLIGGGRDPALRQPTTVGGLAALAAAGWVPAEVAAALTGHYRAHRAIEHRIQMIHDAQTHAVPRDPAGLSVIAALSGEADAAAFARGLSDRLAAVHDLTERFFAPAPAADRPPVSDASQAIIDRWRGYPALRSERARQIFKRVEPALLTRMTEAAHPDEALARFDAFLAGLPAGVQLFALFEANPQLVALLVDICATAPALAAYLSRHAGVLDAVLGGSFFAPWPGAGALREAAAAAIGAAADGPQGSYERALDAARRWLHEWHFRVGVHHLRGLVDADEAAGQYADLADAVIAALVPVVAADLAARHGPAPGRGAVVLGMGSLGARQLNARSDLDLIVIYDAAGVEASDGRRPLAARAWYARLTQALITALGAPTAEGRLYEVDMRLRPSGRQGPVATPLAGFAAYQRGEAWTWEHLALTRARVVGGAGRETAALAAEVEALRLAILAEVGARPEILPDLGGMRARIFAARGPDGDWDAKAGAGGLQDIDLLAQSCALRASDPARSTLAQLRAGRRAGLLDAAEADALSSAHRLLWRLHASARLLAEGGLRMDTVGGGGQALLLRETGAADLAALAAARAAAMAAAAAIIDRAVGGTSAADG